MSSLERIYRLLAPLRLYALGRDSLIDKELAAYGAGFALLEEELAALRRDILPLTALGEALSLHEAAVGLPPRGEAELQDRRRLILARLAEPPLPTAANAKALLAAAGLTDPEIAEEDGSVSLAAAGVAEGLSGELAWRLAEERLPAHLEIKTAAAGHDWDSLGEIALSWDGLDALERSWSLMAVCGIGSE